MTNPSPIETEYQGYRFRSRLEARWAVFFDALEIPWQYEPEGYELPSGRYLPDFRLPAVARGGTCDLWAEVKGNLTHRDLYRLIAAAFELPHEIVWSIRPSILVLGDIPAPGQPWTHTRIDIIGEIALTQTVYFGRIGEDGPYVTRPIGEPVPIRPALMGKEIIESDTAMLRADVTACLPDVRLNVDPDVDRAYRSGRSARFEHGESGSPKPARLTPYVDYSAPLERRAAKALKVTEAVNVSEPKLVPYHVDRPLLSPPIEAPRPSRPRKSPRTT